MGLKDRKEFMAQNHFSITGLLKLIIVGFASGLGGPIHAQTPDSLDETHLKEVGRWHDTVRRLERFRYRDGLIYAISGFRFQIIDVSDWSKPELLSELVFARVESQTPFTNPLGFVDVELVGQRAYIVQAGRAHATLPAKVIDIGDPTAPVELAETPMPVFAIRSNDRFTAFSAPQDLIVFSHDATGDLTERSRISFASMMHGIPAAEIVLDQERIYACIDGTPLVVDVKDLDNPIYRGALLHHSVAPNGNTLYTTGDPTNGPYRLDIWSLSGGNIWTHDLQQNLRHSIAFSEARRISRPYLSEGILYFFLNPRNVDHRVLHAYDFNDMENVRSLGSLTFPASHLTGRSRWIELTKTHLMLAIDGELRVYERLGQRTSTSFEEAYRRWSEQSLRSLPEAMRLPTADPDGDGNRNLIEMATGRDPLQADESLSVTQSTAGISVRYSVSAVAAEFFQFTVEGSADLAPGSWTTIAVNLSGARTFLPKTVRFARLRVERQPHL